MHPVKMPARYAVRCRLLSTRYHAMLSPSHGTRVLFSFAFAYVFDAAKIIRAPPPNHAGDAASDVPGGQTQRYGEEIGMRQTDILLFITPA